MNLAAVIVAAGLHAGATADLKVCTTPGVTADLKVRSTSVAFEQVAAAGNKKKSDEPAPDEVIDPDAPPPPTTSKLFVWKQHPSFRFGKILRLDLEAKVQEDGHVSYKGAQDPTEKGPLQYFDLHRNRIGVQGTFMKKVDFEIERELTEKELSEKDQLAGLTPSSKWKDVNANFSFIKNAQIQVGKFKVPFGLDQLTGVTHNDFVYRSLGASYLAPARDVGGMVHGRFFKHGLNYFAGVFKHDGDNARSKKINGGDRTVAVRVTGTPFRRVSVPSLSAMEIGSAFTISALADDSFRPNGLRGRTVMTQDTFNTLVYVKGKRKRWEADVDWVQGPLSARAEYTMVIDDRLAQGLGDNDLPDARAQAWYVSATWILTGEEKARPVKAAEELLRGGFGAVELAARYERLWFDSVGSTDLPFRNPRADNILPSGDRVLTLGVNWTLNRFIKLQVNGIREHVEDPERNPVPNGASFWSRVIRFQFVL